MASDPSLTGAANGVNNNLGRLVQLMASRFALGAFSGSFKCAASTMTTVTDANVKANSVILLMPFGTAAASLEAGANKPVVTALNAGVSFVITGAGAAAGTEQYFYVIVNVG